jgi:hypothetical protein
VKVPRERLEGLLLLARLNSDEELKRWCIEQLEYGLVEE